MLAGGDNVPKSEPGSRPPSVKRSSSACTPMEDRCSSRVTLERSELDASVPKLAASHESPVATTVPPVGADKLSERMNSALATAGNVPSQAQARRTPPKV